MIDSRKPYLEGSVMADFFVETTDKRSDLDAYTREGLGRLSKEKLMTIISNLQNMPVEVATKVVENIPEYFGICKDTLTSIFSVHQDDAERNDRDAQRVFDAYDSRRKLFEKTYNEAETGEVREAWAKKLEALDKEVEEFRAKIAKERKDDRKGLIKGAVVIVSLAAAGIGVSIKMGKLKF